MQGIAPVLATRAGGRRQIGGYAYKSKTSRRGGRLLDANRAVGSQKGTLWWSGPGDVATAPPLVKKPSSALAVREERPAEHRHAACDAALGERRDRDRPPATSAGLVGATAWRALPPDSRAKNFAPAPPTLEKGAIATAMRRARKQSLSEARRRERSAPRTAALTRNDSPSPHARRSDQRRY